MNSHPQRQATSPTLSYHTRRVGVGPWLVAGLLSLIPAAVGAVTVIRWVWE